MAGEEKTEKATPKKRRDMREKEGSVLQSKEVGVAVSVLGFFAGLAVLGQYMLSMLMNSFSSMIANVGSDTETNVEFFTKMGFDIIRICVLTIGPICAMGIIITILPVVAQTKGLFTTKAMRPKFSRLNPLEGIKKLFSAEAIVGIVKGLIEVAVIGVIVYTQIQSRIREIIRLIDTEPIQGVVYTAQTVFNIVMLIGVVLVFVAAGDYIFQWWRFEKKMKMSKQEIKDEYKQTEGDPQIKGKIKQKQREISQARMMDEVPKSDVVIRNPTHYAVALKYDPTIATSSPRVVAKGADALAMKIVEVAQANDVYITENRPLARALYDSVDIGKEIPPEMFRAVALVLTEMYAAKGTMPDIPKEALKKRD